MYWLLQNSAMAVKEQQPRQKEAVSDLPATVTGSVPVGSNYQNKDVFKADTVCLNSFLCFILKGKEK